MPTPDRFLAKFVGGPRDGDSMVVPGREVLVMGTTRPSNRIDEVDVSSIFHDIHFYRAREASGEWVYDEDEPEAILYDYQES